MAFIVVQQLEGLDEPPLILPTECRERLEELCREVERPIGQRYRAPRARRFPSRRG